MAWLIGTALKLVGSKGWFYRLAGEQARLIDDVTGSTPPTTKRSCSVPSAAKSWWSSWPTALGHGVAVVDVNDLGRVKVLASSRGCDEALLERALRPIQPAMPTNAPLGGGASAIGGTSIASTQERLRDGHRPSVRTVEAATAGTPPPSAASSCSLAAPTATAAGTSTAALASTPQQLAQPSR